MRVKSVPVVSVIVATKNEERNIGACLESITNQSYPREGLELVVVDNNSTDRTKSIARRFTDNVYNRGPNRASQLNFGVRKSTGQYLFYPDADMRLSETVVGECVQKCESEEYVALYVPERVIGQGFWIRVRDFERSFYNGSCIDAIRFVRRSTFLQVGGFDERIEFGPDDWDFDRRVRAIGRVSIVNSVLYHNEGHFSLSRYLLKKSAYSKTIDKYIEKWGERDQIVRKQFGVWYRLFGVFLEGGNWKRFWRRPDLALGVHLLRVMVAIQYMKARVRTRSTS